MLRLARAWTLFVTMTLAGLGLLLPRLAAAQSCNQNCDPSKRNAQGCCPAAPVQPVQPPGPPPGPAVGKKCATSSECPGSQVCIAYKCQLPPATPVRPAPPPPPPPSIGLSGRYWIGVAWNNAGDWAARSGASLAEANALALQACNQVVGKSDCYNSDHPVSNDRPRCIAIFRNGTALRSQEDPNLPTAISGGLASCQAVPGAPGPGCYQQLAVCNDQPVSAPSIWAYVGIGWNRTGFWATRTATSGPEAQVLALEACKKGGAGCFNAPQPVPGERPMCFAIFYDGKDLFKDQDPDLPTAAAAALRACQAGKTAQVCKSQIQACNNRR